MTRPARRRFRIALFALCAMLLTQWTLAVHACPLTRLPASSAVPHATEHGCPDFLAGPQAAEQASDQAHDQASGQHAPASQVDASLCVKHCDDEGQVGGNAPMAAIDAPIDTGLRVALPAPRTPFPGVTAPASGDATAPPLIILYCVSLS